VPLRPPHSARGGARLSTSTDTGHVDLHPVVREDVEQIADRAGEALRELAGATILIAGAAGFLPSYVVDALAFANRRLLARPCRVLAVDNLSTGLPGRLEHLRNDAHVVFLDADVTAPLRLEERVDYVVHGASIASPTWYRRFPLETIDANVAGTRRLLELTRRHEGSRFLLLSSSEIYGDPPAARVPTSEDYWGNVSPTGPRSPYDESKRLAETLAAVYHRLYSVPTVIVRPFNVYGPRLRLDDGRVVPDFLRNALAGEPITLLSSGEATRSFCYISDFVCGLLLLLLRGEAGEAYNLGNDEEVTIRALAETVAELAGGPGIEFAESADPEYLGDNPVRRCPDLAKTKAAIDWRPLVPLRTGIARTLASFAPVAGR
jgi:UDP-glucuronate decarboxylase